MTKSAFIFLMSAAASANALAAEPIPSRTVELDIEHVFAPRNGYDDNDRAELTVDGFLPNGCYTAGETIIQKGEPNILFVRQFATRTDDGECSDPGRLPARLAAPVPFTRVSQLGTLEAGAYRIEYRKPRLMLGYRQLLVAHAQSESIDDQPYADVTAIRLPEKIDSSSDIIATLSGFSTASCVRVRDDVHVAREDDVFVIEPVLTLTNLVPCVNRSVPFETEVNLGRAAPGRYLLHVRSANGDSLNQVFSVTN